MLVDNYDWLSKLQVIPFLRDVGKHFPLGAMIAKESVRSRMGRSEEGISYTEFSYQVLQAYDFMALFDRYRCTLQLGGSDQWGNITAGIELIRRVKGAAAYGITLPLVTKTDGSKFGKTEIRHRVARRAEDVAVRDVPVLAQHGGRRRRYRTSSTSPSSTAGRSTICRTRPRARRSGVRRSGCWRATSPRSCTATARWSEAEAISRALFSGDVEALTEPQLDQACRTMPSTVLGREEVARLPVVELLTRVGLAASRREGRDLVSAGAISINGQKVTSVDAAVSRDTARFGRFIVIRKGKKSYHAATLGGGVGG